MTVLEILNAINFLFRMIERLRALPEDEQHAGLEILRTGLREVDYYLSSKRDTSI